MLAKSVLGNILGEFFTTNTSGHPGPRSHLPTISSTLGGVEALRKTGGKTRSISCMNLRRNYEASFYIKSSLPGGEFCPLGMDIRTFVHPIGP
jgi:hypothetical protein